MNRTQNAIASNFTAPIDRTVLVRAVGNNIADKILKRFRKIVDLITKSRDEMIELGFTAYEVERVEKKYLKPMKLRFGLGADVAAERKQQLRSGDGQRTSSAQPSHMAASA